MGLAGFASKESTERYCRRFPDKMAASHFRQTQGIWLSSIGLGTYLGNYDTETDDLYRYATIRAVQAGCNVIDTAINYRCQRSERSVGAALKQLAANGYLRDELVIATKGGFIPYDNAPPKDLKTYFTETFIQPGIAQPADIVANCHCMTPKYLQNQLDCSLRNLEVETIDVYYIHNPETQLAKVTRDEFIQRLLEAFQSLEEAVSAGKIRFYGAATWNGLRNETTAKDYLALAELVELATRAGGKDHHFKFIQLPINLGMSEALSVTNQHVGAQQMTLLEAAQALGITVMCSASVLQGQLTHDLPPMIHEAFPGLRTDGQRALQFVRSTPGVTTALVGMKQIAHVDENMATAQVAPASSEQYSKLFQSAS
jgi:aryl-alcohol dehydrogenase-like predicted oxidoreductase